MVINYLYVLAATVLRVLPHPWNLTPIGSMFLFSGATFRSRLQSLLVPLGALLISDYALIHILWHGQYGWFSPYTWLGFVLTAVIGWVLRGKITWRRVAVGSLSGSLVFFLVSNFGVWLGAAGMGQPRMYSLTVGGLAQCYVAALPFLRNTLLGDLTYAFIMFGSYYLLQQRRARVTAELQRNSFPAGA
jgi:hypothetical protein